MKYNFVCLLLAPALLIVATDQAWGDSLWRYGYSTQELRSNEGYNKYLKDRYGAEGIRLEGYLVGVTFSDFRRRHWPRILIDERKNTLSNIEWREAGEYSRFANPSAAALLLSWKLGMVGWGWSQ